MNRSAYRIINLITIYRLIAVPVLLALLFGRYLDAFKWALLVSFFTDAVDGTLARHFRVVSVFGAKADSIGDDLTVATGIVGMVLLNPDYLINNRWPILLLLALFGIQLAIAIVRYGKTTSFHTWLAKIAAVFQAMFLLSFFFIGPQDILFYAAVVITGLDLLEEIVMVYILHDYHTDIKGIRQAIQISREQKMRYFEKMRDQFKRNG